MIYRWLGALLFLLLVTFSRVSPVHSHVFEKVTVPAGATGRVYPVLPDPAGEAALDSSFTEFVCPGRVQSKDPSSSYSDYPACLSTVDALATFSHGMAQNVAFFGGSAPAPSNRLIDCVPLRGPPLPSSK